MIQQGDMEDRHRKVGKRTDEITQKIGGLVELREGRFRDGMFHPFIYHHHLHSSSQVWWEVSLVSPNPQSELANSQCACRAHTLELITLRGTQIVFLVLIILCVSGLILFSDPPPPPDYQQLEGTYDILTVASSMPKLEPGSYRISIKTFDEWIEAETERWGGGKVKG